MKTHCRWLQNWKCLAILSHISHEFAWSERLLADDMSVSANNMVDAESQSDSIRDQFIPSQTELVSSLAYPFNLLFGELNSMWPIPKLYPCNACKIRLPLLL